MNNPTDIDRIESWVVARLLESPNRYFTPEQVSRGVPGLTRTQAQAGCEALVERGVLRPRIFVVCENGHDDVWVAERMEDIPFDDIACEQCGDDPGEWFFRRDYLPASAVAQARAVNLPTSTGRTVPVRTVDMSDDDCVLSERALMASAHFALWAIKPKHHIHMQGTIGDETVSVLVFRASGDRTLQHAAAKDAIESLGPVVEPVEIKGPERDGRGQAG